MPAGHTLKSLTLIGRISSGACLDVRVKGVLAYPTGANSWEAGIDADAEIETLDLFDDLYRNPVAEGQHTLTGDLSDIMRQVFTISDVVVPTDSYLRIYMQSDEVLASRAYFSCTYSWEVTT